VAELGPKAGRRIAAGALIAVGILVGLITILLMFSHITSYGVDCGTVLSPKNDPPPNSNPLAGCGGGTIFREVLVAAGILLAMGCIVGGLVMRRRDRRAGRSAGGTAPD
jgi:drug/metabolite transporter (DMT)-like permease